MSQPSRNFFFPITTDFYVKVRVIDAKTKDAVVGGTFSGQMYDYDGSTVGASVSGAAVSEEDGAYDITIPSSLSLIKGEEYTFRMTFTYAGKTNTMELCGKAKYNKVNLMASFSIDL